jgi:hypothetical protein
VEQLTKDVERSLDRLEQEMLSGHTHIYLEALEWWSKLHAYSFNNALLIRMQCPHTQAVAGYKRWQELGYQVKRGATAIWLRAPWLRKETDPLTGEIVNRLIGYFPVAVFPFELTVEFEEGKQLPDPLQPPTGADFEHLYICWTRRLTTLYGIKCSEMHIGRVYGMASPTSIRINARMDFPQKAAALMHETAHILAGHHKSGKSLQQREMEVESATYVLCRMLGVEHPAAADYLINYQVEPNQLRDNLETITKLVKEVKAVLLVGFDGNGEAKEEQPQEQAA